ncbi:hypothetical protein GCM10008922_19460 [Faecalicatena contorta]|uniref:DUF5067 domain-containing protein n=1 Tax=Faecalicatena contorta TaxID=39482 RepID=UPI0031DE374A
MKKRILAILLTLAMAGTLVACGGSDKNKEPEKKQETKETEKKENEVEATALPITIDFEKYTAEIVGAKSYQDTENEAEGIRVYYKFTNHAENSVSPSSVWISGTQSGTELDEGWGGPEIYKPADGMINCNVRPEVSLLTAKMFACELDKGAVEFTVTNYDGAVEETIILDPENLPGAPEQEELFAPVADPKWTDGLSNEGDLSGAHVVIDGFELAASAESNSESKYVRIFYTVTNTGAEAKSLSFLTSGMGIYQDGVGLPVSYYTDYENVETDDVYRKNDLEPGAAVKCSNVYTLRSDNPIEVEGVMDSYSPATFGCRFDLQ